MAFIITFAENHAYLILLALTLLCVATYLITSLIASEIFRSKKGETKPPLVPYWGPILGHALSFFWHTGVVADLTK